MRDTRRPAYMSERTDPMTARGEVIALLIALMYAGINLLMHIKKVRLRVTAEIIMEQPI